ncbi:hypothetical protein SteCoe_37772 [Stentor coeruleus]|uniref:Uncharacterized protein n=1 Tax=Stentor coeruleus TaxID=5963 RepID=A0A1R2AMF1_9CILI|nr:hypothetical protein SteCoe_37772 [Stentor coeruleus]
MRPTEILFKTPRDRTPGPKYYCSLTCQGTSLNYSKKFKDKRSFSTEKRFKSYDVLASRTSVGPGSYEIENKSIMRSSLTRSTVKYMPTLKKYDSTKTNFYMVGNLLITEDSFMKTKKRIRRRLKKNSSRSSLRNYFK